MTATIALEMIGPMPGTSSAVDPCGRDHLHRGCGGAAKPVARAG
jgi:hypothetical protein